MLKRRVSPGLENDEVKTALVRPPKRVGLLALELAGAVGADAALVVGALLAAGDGAALAFVGRIRG